MRPELVTGEAMAFVDLVNMSGDLNSITLANTHYRNVFYTTPDMQLVLMSLQPSEDIPLEIHPSTTQFIRVEQGEAEVTFNASQRFVIRDDWFIIVPSGIWHYVRNTGNSDLKLYTIYSPPEHDVGLVQRRQRNS